MMMGFKLVEKLSRVYVVVCSKFSIKIIMTNIIKKSDYYHTKSACFRGRIIDTEIYEPYICCRCFAV